MDNDVGVEIPAHYPKGFLARQGASPREVAERLEQVGADFVAALDALEDDAFSHPVAPGKWSPAQIADHLVRSNQLLAEAIAKARAGGEIKRMPRGRVTPDGRPLAPAEQEPIPNRIQGDLARDFTASLKRLIEVGLDADPELTCLEHGFFGEMTVLEVLQLSAWHIRHHTKQLPKPPAG